MQLLRRRMNLCFPVTFYCQFQISVFQIQFFTLWPKTKGENVHWKSLRTWWPITVFSNCYIDFKIIKLLQLNVSQGQLERLALKWAETMPFRIFVSVCIHHGPPFTSSLKYTTSGKWMVPLSALMSQWPLSYWFLSHAKWDASTSAVFWVTRGNPEEAFPLCHSHKPSKRHSSGY